ncbi:hypothetical protein AN221_35410 [Streptomyces nanshensis]|uniref:Uncharacterized protein n=1 Tax=Streptomyces nanshensis TaxID=518642 RepID=A0A1E7LIQ7_9ACTN|nr:hypothetical protein AN221_35410 [Streptomyces nanshensis]
MVKESVQLLCLIAAAIHQPVGNDEELAVVRVQGDFTGSPVDIVDLLAQFCNSRIKASGIRFFG